MMGAARTTVRQRRRDLIDLSVGTTCPTLLERRLNLVLELLVRHRYPPPSSSVTGTPSARASLRSVDSDGSSCARPPVAPGSRASPSRAWRAAPGSTPWL